MRPARPQRRRIFIGCEGESERSYVRVLADIADAQGLHLHLDAHVLSRGAGDPLEKVRRAADLAARSDRDRPSRDRFALRAVLLDGDRRADNPTRWTQAEALAGQAGLLLVVQEPDHEALLLRHLPGGGSARPPRGYSLGRLQAAWPDYRKNMPAAELRARITAESVRRACGAEPSLADLLRRLGFRV